MDMMQEKVKNLRELMRMREDLDAEITAAQDEIKDYMTANDTDEILGADYKITWHEVSSTRLDSTALKKALPEIAAQFMKTSITRRFLVA